MGRTLFLASGIMKGHAAGGLQAGSGAPSPAAAGPRGQALIEARSLQRDFDGGCVKALRGADFTVPEGEFVAIVGPSGSGKSTLLQLLGALDSPTAGEVFFRGQPLSSLRDPAGFRARVIGFVFQSFHLLPTLTALENVQVPMFEMPWPRGERRRRAAELLEAFGLGDRMKHLPVKLSGGERQRVAIARSLANEPELLLADEPTGNLDSESAARVLDLLQQIHVQRHMTLVVVTHDADVARQAQRTLRMLDGHIIADTGRGEGRG
jgi:ABC-type lipoprotein export system ATPase subunit